MTGRRMSAGQFFALDQLAFGPLRPKDLVRDPRKWAGQPESEGTARGLLVGLCNRGYARRLDCSPARYEITANGRAALR